MKLQQESKSTHHGAEVFKRTVNHFNKSLSKRVANSVLYKHGDTSIIPTNRFPSLSKSKIEPYQPHSTNIHYTLVKILIIKGDSLSSISSNTFLSLFIATKTSKKHANPSVILPEPSKEDIICSSLKDILIELYAFLSLDTFKLWKISVLTDRYKPISSDSHLFHSISGPNPILYAKISLINPIKANSSLRIKNKSFINSSFAKQILTTRSSIFNNKELQKKVVPSALNPISNSPSPNTTTHMFKARVHPERLDESKPSIGEMDSDNNLGNYDLSQVKSFRDKRRFSPHSPINLKPLEYNTDHFHFFNQKMNITSKKADSKPKLLLSINKEPSEDIDIHSLNAKSLFGSRIVRIKHIKAAKNPSYYDQYVYSTKTNNRTISKGNFRHVRNFIQNRYSNRDNHLPTHSNITDLNKDDEEEEEDDRSLTNPKAVYLQAVYDFNQFFEEVFCGMIKRDDLELMDCLTCDYIFINDLEAFPIDKCKREFLFFSILTKHVERYHREMIQEFYADRKQLTPHEKSKGSDKPSRLDALLLNDNFIKMIQELYFLVKKLCQDIRPFLNTFKFEEKDFKVSSFIFLFFGCSDDYFRLEEEISFKIFNELHVYSALLSFQQFIEYHIYIKYGMQLSTEKKTNVLKKIIPRAWFEEGRHEEVLSEKLNAHFGINLAIIKLLANINEQSAKKYKKLINSVYMRLCSYFYHNTDYFETEHNLLLDLA